MNHLWAPWRIGYIRSAVKSGRIDKKGNCFFCKYVKERKDTANLVVSRGKTAFVVMNKFPYNMGHLMVAPKIHQGKLEKLSDAELLDLICLTRDMRNLLSKVVKPHGFNIGINLGRVAGAGVVGHLHIHIVPRWNGDTNFMPITGATKVMPQMLGTLYKELVNALK